MDSVAGQRRSLDRARISPGQSWRAGLGVALWVIPAVFVLVAILGAFLTDEIDDRIVSTGHPSPWILDRGDVDDLRVLAGTVAGASISTLALVLSLTMVVLSSASTQFGPRLVRSFLRSRVTKVTIGVFSGLFVYSLLVLDSASNASPRRTAGGGFTPDLGGTVVLLWAIAAVCCLIWYVQNIASTIQLPALVAATVTDLNRTLDRVARDAQQGAAGGQRSPADLIADWERQAPVVEAEGAAIVIGRSGYVQQIERGRLIAAASRAGAVVQVLVRAGDFVIDGEVVARVHPASAVDVVGAECPRRIDVGPHRTLDQDLQLAVDQVVEVGLRALSPAINDTFTGLTCIDWLTDALITLDGTPLDRTVFVDEGGTVRLVERQRSYAGIVNSAYEKLREAGVDNPAITIRILESIARVARVVGAEDAREALRRQAEACYVAAVGRYVPLDAEGLTRRYDAVVELLGTGSAPKQD